MADAKIEPKVGQRWADNDKRHAERRREVVIRSIINHGRPRAECDVYEKGVKTRATVILISRLKPTSTGYRYVGEGPPS